MPTVIAQSRRRTLTAACLVGALGLASAAHAQFVPNIPDATPPTPEYVPAPEPKPDPGLGSSSDRPAGGSAQNAAPSIPEPIPSLVVRDDAGKIKTLPIPTDLAALRAMKTAPEQAERITKAIADRQAQIDRLVAANPDRAIVLRDAIAKLDDTSELSELFTLRDRVAPLMPQASFLDALTRAGALSVPQRTRIEQAVKEYDTARRGQWQEQFGKDEVVVISSMIARDKIRQFSYEPLNALDRLLDQAAAQSAKIAEDRDISAEARASLPKPNEKDAAKTAASFKAWFFDLKSTNDQAAVLKAVAPPAP